MLTSLPWTAVTFEDAFWAPRLRVVREQTLPALYQQCLASGRIDALRLSWRPGQHPVPHQFWDSDVAKWLEASAYALAAHPDAWLQARVDEVVGLFAAAQQPDGYLNSYVTSVKPHERWADLRDGHELYCAGHVIEAGVAHFLSTGQRSLLDVVCRYADYIHTVFGTAPGQLRGYCGHPEIELALVRLYRATGNPRYLELSRYFVEERGQEPYYFDVEAARRTRPRTNDGYYRRHGLRGQALREYNQSHLPVRQQRRVVGHAVRAMYLYSAVADLALELHDEELEATCQALWSHLVTRRMYVTGGIGSSPLNEGFSSDYDLPNAEGYAESCAAVGLVMWAQRMLRLCPDARYADVMENVLYNAIAAAIGSDGRHFFYANPLASDGDVHRQPWFQVACCPPNIARLLTSLGQYVYSMDAEHVAVHLYIRGTATFEVAGQRVRLRQEHDYPWNGRLRLHFELEQPAEFALWLRMPGWSQQASLRVSDVECDYAPLLRNGYVRVQRLWRDGDCLELNLPMRVQRVYAHPRVAQDVGRVALRRGPLVYCIEEADNASPLESLALPHAAEFSERHQAALLDGIVELHANAVLRDAADWDGQLYRADQPALERSTELTAVPYAVWDNRAAGQMRVWIHETREHATA